MPTPRERPAPRGRSRAAAPPAAHLNAYTWLVLITAVVLLGGYVARIYIEHQTTVLGREWEKKNRELAFLIKEQDNLRMEKESYTNGAYILATAHKLNLMPPQPGQVRRLPALPPTVVGRDGLLAANRK